MDQQTVPPAIQPPTPPTNSKIPKIPLNKKTLIFILGITLLILLIPLILLSTRQKPAPPPVETPKTWEITLSYNTQTQTLTLSKLSLLEKEINQDFRLAQFSPYELVVLDKDDRALFRSRIVITEQIFDLNETKAATDSASINSLDTILYVPFKPSGAKIMVNKNFSPILQVNIPPQISFNLVEEVHAQTPSRSGPMQVVFAGDGYTNNAEFQQDVADIQNVFNQTPPYAGTNIFDFKTLNNPVNTGCSGGISACLGSSSTTQLIQNVSSSVRNSYPGASKFIALVKISNTSDGTYGASLGSGGELSIIAKRPDRNMAQIGQTAVHEFLGHSVAFLWDRYIVQSSVNPAFYPKSNCTSNPQGENFWNLTQAYRGCMSPDTYSPSPRTCPDPDNGNPNTLMSNALCRTIQAGFDPVEQKWIRDNILPLYQSAQTTPQPTTAPQPTTQPPAISLTPTIPSTNTSTTNTFLQGYVFIDRNRNGVFEYQHYYPSLAEYGYNGAQLQLGSGQTASTGSDQNRNIEGYYKFPNIPSASTQIVTLNIPAGYEITSPRAYGPNGQDTTLNVLASNRVSVSLAPGWPNIDVWFGIAPIGSAAAPTPTTGAGSPTSTIAQTPSPTPTPPSSTGYSCSSPATQPGSGNQVQIVQNCNF